MNTAGKIFLDAIAENKVKFDICDLNPRFGNQVRIEDAKLLPKESASPSEVIFDKLVAGKTSVDVSIKIFLDIEKAVNPSNPEEALIIFSANAISGLKYEVKLYKQILRLIQAGKSPHFVNFIGYAECKLENVFSFLSGDQRYRLQESLKENYGTLVVDHPEIPVCILLTEKIGSGQAFGLPNGTVSTLSQLVSKENFQPIDSIFFQLIYTLALMDRESIMHNDLHSGNILVTRFPKKIKMLYGVKTRVETKYYLLDTMYVPYIYDFDFGYSSKLGKNAKLNDFPDFTWENKFIAKFDLYTLLCMFGFKKLGGLYNDSFLARNEENREEVFGVSEEQEAKLIPEFVEIGDGIYIATKADLERIHIQVDNDTPNYLINFNRRNKMVLTGCYEIPEGEAKKLQVGDFGEQISQEQQIYKVSKSQFENLTETKLDTTSLNIVFQMLVFKTANKVYYLAKLHNPHRCRPNVIPPNFPAPLPLLLKFKRFEKFQIEKEKFEKEFKVPFSKENIIKKYGVNQNNVYEI
jgi:serine/threonine protein kinase